MLLTIIVIIALLLNSTLLGFGIYVFINFNKHKQEKPSINSNIIRDGVKSAIQEIEEENEIKEDMKIDHRNKMRFSERVYSNIPSDSPIKHSDGDLIPFDLSQEDKDLLNMFYSKED